MKRSKSVNLVLLGVGLATLSGCAKEVPLFEDTYSTLEECRKDWGPDQQENTQCDPVHNTTTGHTTFIGPIYHTNPDNPNELVRHNTDGSTTTFYRPFLGAAARTVTPSKTSNFIGGSHSEVTSRVVSRSGFGGHASSFSSGG